MAKKIRPQDVALQLNYEPPAITDFCADVMEDANDHNLAAALRAVNAMQYDLACEFIQLEKDQEAAGELTTELRDRRYVLLDRLREASGS